LSSEKYRWNSISEDWRWSIMMSSNSHQIL